MSVSTYYTEGVLTLHNEGIFGSNIVNKLLPYMNAPEQVSAGKWGHQYLIRIILAERQEIFAHI